MRTGQLLGVAKQSFSPEICQCASPNIRDNLAHLERPLKPLPVALEGPNGVREEVQSKVTGRVPLRKPATNICGESTGTVHARRILV